MINNFVKYGSIFPVAIQVFRATIIEQKKCRCLLKCEVG